MSGLDGGRIGIAAQSLGVAEAAMAGAVKYAKERVRSGKPIAAKQGLPWYLADMATRLEAARLLVYNAASERMAGGDISQAAAMAKYYASEAACYICDLSLQIHGGYGYVKDYDIERLYRDARILRILRRDERSAENGHCQTRAAVRREFDTIYPLCWMSRQRGYFVMLLV